MRIIRTICSTAAVLALALGGCAGGGGLPDATPRPGTSTGSMQTFQGTVGRVDRQQGWFELESPYSVTLVVALPYDVERATVDRFHRLQGGETVRIQGTRLDAQRVELYRFY